MLPVDLLVLVFVLGNALHMAMLVRDLHWHGGERVNLYTRQRRHLFHVRVCCCLLVYVWLRAHESAVCGRRGTKR